MNTHKKTIAHLPEIHSTTRIKIDIRVNLWETVSDGSHVYTS